MLDLAMKTVRDTPAKKFRVGCVAKFVSMQNGWGIKCYLEEEQRDVTYELQSRAYNLGFGPAIGEKIEFRMRGKSYFGYITECATVIKDEFCKKHNVPEGIEFWDYADEYLCELAEEAASEMRALPEYNKLISTMKDNGYRTWDMHWGNVGYLPDGSLVCIDFDRCATSV